MDFLELKVDYIQNETLIAIRGVCTCSFSLPLLWLCVRTHKALNTDVLRKYKHNEFQTKVLPTITDYVGVIDREDSFVAFSVSSLCSCSRLFL